MQMPEPDRAVIGRRAAIAADLRRLLPSAAVIDHEDERRVLRKRRADRLSPDRRCWRCCRQPRRRSPQVLALLPRAAASRWCRAAPAPRCRAARCRWPTASCWACAKFNRILEIDYDNRCAGGAAGRHQSRHHPRGRRAQGFYYAPDPSSQIACTIGGNVAENSGGVHCLKYGADHQQRAGRRDGADRRRGRAAGRQASRRRRAMTCWA